MTCEVTTESATASTHQASDQQVWISASDDESPRRGAWSKTQEATRIGSAAAVDRLRVQVGVLGSRTARPTSTLVNASRVEYFQPGWRVAPSATGSDMPTQYRTTEAASSARSRP